MIDLARYRLLLAALAATCLWPGLLAAEEAGKPILLLEQTQAAAEFDSIDTELNLLFRRDDQPLQVPASDLLRWGTLSELRGRETVVLTDGSLLTGAAARIHGGGVKLEHSVFDPLELPRSALRGIVLRRPASPLDFDRLLDRLAREDAALDTLLLENGDSLSGTLVELPTEPEVGERQTTIAIETEGTRFETPLELVSAIAFKSSQSNPKPSPRLQVGLRQGDLLQVASVAVNNRTVKMQLAAGPMLITDPEYLWADVTYLHGNSSRLLPLSSLQALSYRHLPLLGWETPLAIDSNVLGGRLRAADGLYAKGLGMPGSSRVAFRLEGKYRQLVASIAVDDAADQRGSVVFRVYRWEGKGSPELIHQSEVIRGDSAPVPIRLDVTDVPFLVLLVDQADRGDELDYADWLDAYLVK